MHIFICAETINAIVQKEIWRVNMNQELKDRIQFLYDSLEPVEGVTKDDLKEELIALSMSFDVNDERLSAAIKQVAKEYLDYDVTDEKIAAFTLKNKGEFLFCMPKTLAALIKEEKDMPAEDKITPYVMRTFQQYAYEVMDLDGRRSQHRTVMINNFFEWIREGMNQAYYEDFWFCDVRPEVI